MRLIPVAREGFPFIAAFAVVAAAVTHFTAIPLLSGVLWGLTGWCVWFFRDPERVTPDGQGLIIAPADGRVVVVEEVAQAPLSGAPARKVSIFMNVFSVHVNRIPESGRVLETAYHPGKFVNAVLDKASSENERMEVLLEMKNGQPLIFVQVAGLIARRIVCYLEKGAEVERGARFGLIRFGSRVDLYLPLGAKVAVELGEKTCAGKTVVARLGQ